MALPYMINIGKGRFNEFFNRVDANDPAASAIILIPISAAGVEATIIDAATVAAVLASATEITTNNWARKVLTDTELAAPAPTNASDYYGAAFPAVTWGPPGPTAAGNTVALLWAYDNDTAAGTDANLIPFAMSAFAVTADGNNVVINAGDVARAS